MAASNDSIPFIAAFEMSPGPVVYPSCLPLELPPPYGRPNIERSASPAADPIPCALREDFIEDCSHAKLANFIWRRRATAHHLTDLQRNECPMPFCRKLFNDLGEMIFHLQRCPEVARGYYWCWDCYRAEKIPFAHQNSFATTVKKVKRVLSKSLSFKRKRSRTEDQAASTAGPSATGSSTTSPSPTVPEIFGRESPQELLGNPRLPPQCPDQLNSAELPGELPGELLPGSQYPSQTGSAELPGKLPPAPQYLKQLNSAELPGEPLPAPQYPNYFAPPLARAPPAPSLSKVSVMSLNTSMRPRRGSQISLISPLTAMPLAARRGLSPLFIESTAGETASPITDAPFCESPVQLDEPVCWPAQQSSSPTKASSWDSITTYAAPPKDAPELAVSCGPFELEGSTQEGVLVSPEKLSYPDPTDSFAKLKSHSASVEPIYDSPTKLPGTPQGDPVHARASQEDSPLLNVLKQSVSARFKDMSKSFGVGPLVGSLRSMTAEGILFAGIDELERQLCGQQGGVVDKFCFASLALAMADAHELEAFHTRMVSDVERFVQSDGRIGLGLVFLNASTCFLDGLQSHLHFTLSHRCDRVCECRILNPMDRMSTDFLQVTIGNIDSMTQGSSVRDIELDLISSPRRYNHPQPNIDPTTFFEAYLPAVHDLFDNSYCNCTGRTDHYRWTLAFMRQYYFARLPSPAAGESRQNSWGSMASSSTVWGSDQPSELQTLHKTAIPVEVQSKTHPPRTTLSPRPPRTPSPQRPCRKAPALAKRRPSRSLLPRRESRLSGSQDTYSCPHCEYEATGTDRGKLFRRHMTKHDDTEVMYVCDFPAKNGLACRKQYNRKDNLQAHQKKAQHSHVGKPTRLLRKRTNTMTAVKLKHKPNIE